GDGVSEVSIEKYEILEKIDQGGMGVVYKARQKFVANRLVALKMIRAGSANPQLLSRFQLEIQTAAKLQHPHIVPIYDVGESRGSPFYAREYMEEGSLADKCAGQPQAPTAAARLIHKLAQAVQHAHHSNIIHRDLKPRNVLLGRRTTAGISDTPTSAQGQTTQSLASPSGDVDRPERSTVSGFELDQFDPKVSDFGIAKILDVDAGETRTDQIVGTPSY